MLDLILGLGLLAALIGGYRRGFVRSATEMAGFVLAVLVGYRSGPAAGVVIESWSGADPVAAQVIGSVIVFAIILAGATLIARRLVWVPPPLRPLDRIAGAIVSGVWFAVLAILVLIIAGAFPILPGRFEGLLSESRAARIVLSEEAGVTPAVSRLLGDRVLESLVNINDLLGRSQVVIEADDYVELPAAGSRELVSRPDSARELFDKVNRARIEEGVETVAWSAALADVAGGHGLEMYEQGYFSHRSPIAGSLGDRLEMAGIPFRAAGENLALSPTVSSVHEGLLSSEAHRATMLDPRFTRVGVSALEGPLGLMVVQVFTG